MAQQLVQLLPWPEVAAPTETSYTPHCVYTTRLEWRCTVDGCSWVATPLPWLVSCGDYRTLAAATLAQPLHTVFVSGRPSVGAESRSPVQEHGPFYYANTTTPPLAVHMKDGTPLRRYFPLAHLVPPVQAFGDPESLRAYAALIYRRDVVPGERAEWVLAVSPVGAPHVTRYALAVTVRVTHAGYVRVGVPSAQLCFHRYETRVPPQIRENYIASAIDLVSGNQITSILMGY